ncbi:MAG: ribonuclease HII, partial [Prevotella sp.]|nr:ribonuclease HII [Prevotella sp.]
SKQMSAKKRYTLRTQIEHDALAWAVGVVTPEEIDRINILNASFLAMHRALDLLTVRPEAIIVDGNRFKPYRNPSPTSTEELRSTAIFGSQQGLDVSTLSEECNRENGQFLPHTCIIKGDGKYLSIAAASILAKTYRDDYMDKLAREYPQYDWLANKGYPTRRHREAIKAFGITPYHRKSYNLLGDGQLSFEFREL